MSKPQGLYPQPDCGVKFSCGVRRASDTVPNLGSNPPGPGQHWVKSTCPLDCFDSCSLRVEVRQGRVERVTGDPEHPLTRGFICSKGRRWRERLYSPQRVLQPLRRFGSTWQPVSWEEALGWVAARLEEILAVSGPLAVLHVAGDGSGGLLHDLDRRFFRALGGLTQPEGSLCWGSGLAAQVYDFGANRAHFWEDLLHARTIVLWGRNPLETNIHLVPFLRQAHTAGARIISVNPQRIRLEGLDALHIQPRPGTDGALALGVVRALARQGGLDEAFIQQHVLGAERVLQEAERYDAAAVERITGVDGAAVEFLATAYGRQRPTATLFGYGMQRYVNGGNTVRAIDALAALSGNVGVAGSGANYADRSWRQVLYSLSGPDVPAQVRTIPFSRLGEGIVEQRDPPIRAIFVTRANPVTQVPDTSRVMAAFRKAELSVVVDHFLTDTAQAADLFLPCTTVLEEEDIVISSWNPYGGYVWPAVPPQGGARRELDIFTDLARRLGVLDRFGEADATAWLARALAPAERYGVTLERFRQEGTVASPLAQPVAWQDGRFATPSGKVELVSAKAKEETGSAWARYSPPAVAGQGQGLVLITPHVAHRLHSQYFNLEPEGTAPRLPHLRLHPHTAARLGLARGEKVEISTSQGSLHAFLQLDPSVHPETAVLPEGHWLSSGGGVNLLTPALIPDMGLGTPFYDVRCQVRPAGHGNEKK